MKKQFLFFAVAALALASCSSENDVVQTPNVVEQTADDGVVSFSAYVNRSTTRAGDVGTLTTSNTTAPNISLQAKGFGVFGYYTNGVPYGETAIPDFFYNQKVTGNGTEWTYEPVKYWPNEFGESAISEGQDKLTFFAYAPYVTVIPGTGRIDKTVHTAENAETSGIVGLTSNTSTGDPYVKYYVDFDPDNRVDLCWGVAKTAFTSSVDDDKSPNAIDAGSPYIDVVKPKINDKIFFDFKHALAALNVTIDADIDEVSHGNKDFLDKFTKIWVRSITFEGFAMKGKLNLNATASEGPLWYDISSANTKISGGTVTIYDGRRDGKEGQSNATASNENPTGLNKEIVQSEPYVNTEAALVTAKNLVTSTPLSGVTSTPQNLFDATKGLPIYVIPTDEYLKVTIVYDVETYDGNLSTFLSDGVVKGSSIENAITKDITMGGSNLKLEAGKVYNLNLHLGMTSVKFDASVTPWETLDVDNTDLPVNTGGYIAGVPGSINVPAAAVVSQTFSLTGLTGTGVTASAGSSVVNGAPTVAVNGANGIVTYSTNANTTVKNRTESITFTETGGSATTTTITFNQAAAELGLKLATGAVDLGGKKITITSTGTTTAGDWKSYIVVRERAGVTKTFGQDDTAADGIVKITGNAGYAEIEFADANELEAGDVYTITAQAGDAPAETVICTIGGVAYSSSVYKIKTDGTFTNTPTIYGTGTLGYSEENDGGNVVTSVNPTSGLVTLTGTSSATAAEVQAQLTASDDIANGIFYTTNSKKATYNLYVSDVRIGGVYNIYKEAASNKEIIVCGLPNSTGTTATANDTEMITAVSTTAPANGIATVTYTVSENTSSAERTATITINGASKFYITQSTTPTP